VKTNKKKVFSIYFQSIDLGNNSNNLLQISHSLLFSMSQLKIPKANAVAPSL